MADGTAYTHVRLQGVNTSRLWDRTAAGTKPSRLQWTKDTANGLRALYQLYLYSPRPYAKRLMDLIYWQDPKLRTVRFPAQCIQPSAKPGTCYQS